MADTREGLSEVFFSTTVNAMPNGTGHTARNGFALDPCSPAAAVVTAHHF